MADEDFSIIESAQDALHTTPTSRQPQQQAASRTIEERIIANYYVEEYLSLDNLNVIRQNSIKEGLRSCRFRSLCWRIFLECLPEASSERIGRIRTLRARYEEIRKKHRKDPRLFKDEDNPLSQDETSHWNQYFSDDELQSRILKDVVRAFPDIVFFQQEKIQSLMRNILFNYARENPQIEYKQGMHEILAPLIFVIHCDHQTYLFAQENGLVENEIRELLDAKYLEHDSYFLFMHVMERIESWYDNNSIKTIKKNEYVNLEPFSNDIDFNCYSKIGVKLKMINEQILRRTDEQLYQHLKDLHIPPQIFGIRWMRLLFIREFQMQDLLVVWDAIFANGFGLCDYIFTAMLVVISKILLPCDYSNCLNHLMRYPSVCDVHYVIHLALHIRDPINYPAPVEHSTLVLPNPNAIKVQQQNQSPNSPTKSFLKFPTSRPKSLVIANQATESRGNRPYKASEMKNMSFEWIEDKFTKSSANDLTGDQDRSLCCSSAKEVDQLRYMIDFCALHMTKSLECFQSFVNEHNKARTDNDPEAENVLIALAEMKKIRDILKGTIAFENI